MKKFTIRLDDKPHLAELMRENPEQAKEIISTFVQMMEEAAANGWADLPKEFYPNLTFREMIEQVLHGLLDLHDIDPEFYKDLGVSVHPFSLFSTKVPTASGGTAYWDWQRHFDWSKGELHPIQSLLRKLMYYSRYIEVAELGKALFHDHVHTYMVERDPTSLLVIQPALKYQRDKLGERFVGKLMDTNGLFDCGTLPDGVDNICPACQLPELLRLNDHVRMCRKCSAGFRVDT